MTQPTEYEQVSYNSPDGVQIGKSATEKVGFFGATPIAQRSLAAQATASLTLLASGAGACLSTTDFTNMIAQIEEIRATLAAVGLFKGSA